MCVLETGLRRKLQRFIVDPILIRVDVISLTIVEPGITKVTRGDQVKTVLENLESSFGVPEVLIVCQ